MKTEIYIGIGSNLGDRKQNLLDAQELLGLKAAGISSVYETEPVGYLAQPWFMNAVICVETDLRPLELLWRCQEVELHLGRKREILKGPRTIDLDILFYGDLIWKEPRLIIPHPAIPERRFVLKPMNEIAPHFVHPVLRKSIADLLLSCPDTSIVRIHH